MSSAIQETNSDTTLQHQAEKKYEQLQSLLASYGNVIVALSGGLDSSFVLYASVQTLGTQNTIAAIGVSPSLAASEQEAAVVFARDLGLPDGRILLLDTEELSNPDYARNPTNRCYFCKTELYTRLDQLAKESHIAVVCDGSNASDIGDFRPGMIAARRKSVRSPLLEVGLTKTEIRLLARKFTLNIWDKPQSACLASRIPYGSEVTVEKLKQIEAAENYLKSLGFRQVRVRHHGDVARIELPIDETPRLLVDGISPAVATRLKEIGFTYVTVDIEGFRSGSMNEKVRVRDE